MMPFKRVITKISQKELAERAAKTVVEKLGVSSIFGETRIANPHPKPGEKGIIPLSRYKGSILHRATSKEIEENYELLSKIPPGCH